jgi:hypothetical protein
VKKKVKKLTKVTKEAPKPVVEITPEKENQYEFGGLPKRDLKRNLGCG